MTFTPIGFLPTTCNHQRFRIEADVAWLTGRLAVFPQAAAVTLRDKSSELGALALPGSRGSRIYQRLFSPEPLLAGPPCGK